MPTPVRALAAAALTSLLCTALSAALPSTVAAQATFVGKVTNQTQVPVAGALVVVPRLRLSTQTNDAGVFRLTLPAERIGQQDTMRVTRIGYGPRDVVITVRAGTNAIDVTLVERAVALNEVVVTGTVGNQERRAQAAVVASVDASNIVQTAPVSSVQQLLSGRVPGVSVTQANGSVGSTSVIRIRGVSSISLSNEPLVFIDGIRIDNRNLPIAGGNVSSLSAIDPTMIESIEVVKGPAAATLYGADASAGVIQIITKKGTPGQTRFTQSMTAELGTARPHWTPPTNYATCGANDVLATSTSALCRGQSVGTIVSDNPIVREDLLRDGRATALNWQGRGGGTSYGFFLGYGYTNEIATVPANDLLRHNLRANFTALPRGDLTIDAGFGFVRDVNNQLNVGDNIYGMLTALIGSPLTVGTATNGWFAPNRNGVAISNISNRVTTARFEPHVTARYEPRRWFTNRVTIGGDISRIFYRQFYPKNDIGWYAGNFNQGQLREDRNAFDTWTLDYLGNVRREFMAGRLDADVSFGAQVIDRLSDSLTANGYGLATNSSATISALTTVSAGGGKSTQRFVGYLGQLQLGYADKLFVQAGARIDRNSSFANTSETFFLPKVGVSYVISEEPFFKSTVPWVPTMRVRAAYGTTGRAPQPGAALETYTNGPFVFNNATQGAGVIPRNPGNDSLRAEKGTEFEAGFEIGMFHERLGIDFTYFNKITKDLIIQRPIPTSLGFTENPWANVGKVSNRGVEVAVRAQLLTMRDVGLDVRASVATLRNRLESLGGVSAFGTGVNQLNRFVEGYPVGGWWSPRVESVDVANGFAVVTTHPTTGEADLAYGGSPIPTYEGTFSSDLTLFRSFRVNGLVEFKGGHRKLNTSMYFREKAFTQEERYQRRNDLPAEERIRLFGPYRTSTGRPVASSAIVDDYLDDAGFVRLRELSFSYTVPTELAARMRASSATISAGGRNLKLWTDYKGGWDPESITYVPTNGVFFAADFLTMPQPQRFFVRLNLGF
jgi:TonB-linked SusC/RagA family outer membrane protein